MKLEKMTQGMVLHSHGRDGTVLRRKCSWPVRVIEVNLKTREVFASWNNNPPRWWSESVATKWQTKSHAEKEREHAVARVLGGGE